MRVKPFDETLPAPEPHSDRPVVVYIPFRCIEIGRNSELRIDLSESTSGGRAVSTRLFRSGGRDRPLQPDRPMHLFPDALVALIATLTEAAVAIGAMPEPKTAAVATGGPTADQIDHVRRAAALARDVATLGRHVSADFAHVDPATLPPGEMERMQADFDRAQAAAPFNFLDCAPVA